MTAKVLLGGVCFMSWGKFSGASCQRPFGPWTVFKKKNSGAPWGNTNNKHPPHTHGNTAAHHPYVPVLFFFIMSQLLYLHNMNFPVVSHTQ